jgi:hypothetical protein
LTPPAAPAVLDPLALPEGAPLPDDAAPDEPDGPPFAPACDELPPPVGVEDCDPVGLFVAFETGLFFPEPDPEHA